VIPPQDHHSPCRGESPLHCEFLRSDSKGRGTRVEAPSHELDVFMNGIPKTVRDMAIFEAGN